MPRSRTTAPQQSSERFRIEAFVNNLFDEAYWVQVFGPSTFDPGSQLASASAPRTFGAQATVRF